LRLVMSITSAPAVALPTRNTSHSSSAAAWGGGGKRGQGKGGAKGGHAF
jgi:hypothetical protein